MANGPSRHMDVSLIPPISIAGSTIGVAILGVAGPAFHSTPSASIRARHALPSAFIWAFGGQVHPGGSPSLGRAAFFFVAAARAALLSTRGGSAAEHPTVPAM